MYRKPAGSAHSPSATRARIRLFQMHYYNLFFTTTNLLLNLRGLLTVPAPREDVFADFCRHFQFVSDGERGLSCSSSLVKKKQIFSLVKKKYVSSMHSPVQVV